MRKLSGNLVLGRKVGEAIVIGDPVHTVVRVVEVDRGKARLLVESEGNLILREEVAKRGAPNQATAPGSDEAPDSSAR